MSEERFWLLVSLKLSGEASAAEIAELENLLLQYPEFGMRTELLNGIWQATSVSTINKEASFNRHMQRLSNHLSEPVLQYDTEEIMEEAIIEEARKPFPIRRMVYWMSGIAASVLMAFLVFTKNSGNPAKDGIAKNTVSTKRGSKSNIQLPDGTQVWLNADSKITYNEKFQGAIREVYLNGEAFFDVVRDESRPFIIHANAIDVKVLGTSFNVRAYANEKNTETSLIHGSVEITLRCSPDKKIILKPSEKLIVQNEEVTLVGGKAKPIDHSKQPLLTLSRVNFEKKDSSVIETLWVKNKLAFDGEAFEDIALKIERWFDVKVNISGDKLRKTPFTAVFDGENLPQVMEALRISGNFNYYIDKKEVTIYP
jgi:ferric-dicitrate binding protein FerR (iron transport regulator)